MKVKSRMPIQILKSPQGFTLIETMISLMLICVMAVACAGLVAYFARYTKQDTINSCLLQAASSGIEAKRADPAITSITVSCGDYTVSVNITGTLPSPAPAMGSGITACAQIVSTSAIGSKTMVLNDLVCNFPED
jgi:prepilin-type N-terminal cleavage/methylation domain-containing protein